jgi:hypothetical protein
MFGWSNREENLLANYKALISDLRDQIRERDALIASLVAQVGQSKPAPVPVKRPSQTPPPSQPSRIHWPGYMPNLRPPSPKAHPTANRVKELTDVEASAVRESQNG